MHEYYPEIEPYRDFFLSVDDTHNIYVEECGNPEGQPVIFLHGGPGGGCSSNNRRFFDPSQYRIILFDQRGCGRSTPFGSLKDNTTQHLIEDMESIRRKLGIERWHVFGGSWGSTLALVYAQAYADKVISLVLRGIFLARTEDATWTFAGGGAAKIFPDYWAEYKQAYSAPDTQISIQVAYDILTGEDQQAATKLAKAWTTWEMRCCTLKPDADFVAAVTNDKNCWTLARHEAHFMIHDCFLTEHQILDNCYKISTIPTTIVHGRYDIICPLENAWALKQQLPNALLVVSEASGHTSVEVNTKHHLINATNAMLLL